MFSAFSATNSRIYLVDINKILPCTYQARKSYDPLSLARLAESIKLYGIIQPVTLRRKNGVFELVAGERRIRAARMAGLRKVPATVQKMGDYTAMAVSFCENLQRENLSYFEQAEEYDRQMKTCKIGTNELAYRLSEDKKTINSHVSVLSFSPRIRRRLERLKLGGEYINALYQADNEDMQSRIIDETISKKMSPEQSLEFALMLSQNAANPPVRKEVVCDAKIYLNTIARSCEMINRFGGNAQTTSTDDGEYVVYSVKIKKSDT